MKGLGRLNSNEEKPMQERFEGWQRDGHLSVIFESGQTIVDRSTLRQGTDAVRMAHVGFNYKRGRFRKRNIPMPWLLA